ncbi:hypothetical protein TUM20984_03670 [Mycobacterium antarcticum]|nr:hypothetical protein TUM20984_03670 [Mycolicibacterium sp. TUM20984]
MRVLGTIGVILAIAALGVAPPDTPGPQIILADHTIALDPPADPGNGSLPNGDALTPFDVQDPAVGRLDPALLSAIQNASTAATADGITMTITSGWRSPEFQQRLLDDAVHTYGSFTAAREYVQTPEASKHVVGAAGRRRRCERRSMAHRERHPFRALSDLRQRTVALRTGDRR